MNALIVEDEELSVRRLRKLLYEVAPNLSISGVTDSIGDTVNWLEQNRTAGNADPDLIFLDIELSDGQSFEIFNRTDINSAVVFTTSYDEYALQAFKVNSIDYLLKPVHRDDLLRSLQKYEHLQTRIAHSPVDGIRKLLEEFQKNASPEYRQRFLVKLGQRLLSIETADISYFFLDDRYSFFMTTTNQKLLVDYTLDELEDMLDPAKFFRINRGMIVTHKSVTRIDPYFGSRLSLSLLPALPKETLVSREKVTDFKTWMGK
jgi:two-component system, LytTR family, response regulator LytT